MTDQDIQPKNSSESLGKPTRNEQLLISIEQGYTPVLPFETPTVIGQDLSYSAETFDCPGEDDHHVTLGSMVEIIYEDVNEPEIVFITGATKYIDAINAHTDANLPEHATAATLASPLGQCLLGAVQGDVRVYTANKRKYKVTVCAVVQAKISEK